MDPNRQPNIPPMDPCEYKRYDPAWVEQMASSPNARFLPFHNLLILAKGTDQLGWLSTEYKDQLVKPGREVVLLGTAADVPHFLVDVSDLDNPLQTLGLGDGWRFINLREFAETAPRVAISIGTQARSLIYWNTQNRFCISCGAPCLSVHGGYRRQCSQCDQETWPRVDPVVIVLIHDGDDRCLLVRSKQYREPHRYSCPAGHLNQGEALEEAVSREMKEETNITVTDIRYHSSQPWPFPYKLMAGFFATAVNHDIIVDTEELIDARWFSRSEIQTSLNGDSSRLLLPSSVAIANHLISDWLQGTFPPAS